VKQKFLISSDISDNKKRRKVVRLLEEYGIRWQESVFCCSLSKTERDRVVKKLGKIAEKSDSVFVLPLSEQTIELTEFVGLVKDIAEKKPAANVF